MFKAGLLFLIFTTATIYCQSAQEKWQTKEILVKSANIKLLLKYRGSGLTYFDYTDKEYKELLNVIKLFYTDRDSEHYLGEITRTGVYDAKGNAVYVLPENLQGSYISSRNLSFPTKDRALYRITYLKRLSWNSFKRHITCLKNG